MKLSIIKWPAFAALAALAGAAALALCSCSASSAASSSSSSSSASSAPSSSSGSTGGGHRSVGAPEALPVADVPLASKPVGLVLKASAFKMSGNYSKNVAVTVDSGGRLTYFPAPSDLGPESCPVEIGEGWWLNRQGLGANSVFTKWTFDEYRALERTPAPDEIKAAVIPGACVTAFMRLPVTASEATGMPASSLLEYLP